MSSQSVVITPFLDFIASEKSIYDILYHRSYFIKAFITSCEFLYVFNELNFNSHKNLLGW